MLWNDLPLELKQAVVDRLPLTHIRPFSHTCREAYLLSLPSLYVNISIDSTASLQSFLHTVPLSHCAHVRQLSLDLSGSLCPATATTDLITLLIRCDRVFHFTLTTPGVLKPDVIPAFANLRDLTNLTIKGSVYDANPLSERLVTSICLSIPSLTSITLSSITRSSTHAPNLLGVPPFIPLASNDTDIPPHPNPLIGSALSLPSLLVLQNLQELRITDTHLGDPRWLTVPVLCTADLKVVELGGSADENASTNGAWAERILARVSQSGGVEKLVLGAGVSSAVFDCASQPSESNMSPKDEEDECICLGDVEQEQEVQQAPVQEKRQQDEGAPCTTRIQPFVNLRALRLTALHPLEHLPTTLTTFSSLSSSSAPTSPTSHQGLPAGTIPIEQLDLECHEDDVEEYLEVLGEWLEETRAAGGWTNEPMTGVESGPGTPQSNWCLSPTTSFSAFDWGAKTSMNPSLMAEYEETSTSRPRGFSTRSSISSTSSLSSISTSTSSDWEDLITPVDSTPFGTALYPSFSPTQTPSQAHGTQSKAFPLLRRVSLSTVADVLDSDAPSTMVFDFAVDDHRGGSTNTRSNDYVHQHPLVMLNTYLDGVHKNHAEDQDSDGEDVDTRAAQPDCALYHSDSNGMTKAQSTNNATPSKKMGEKTMVHSLPCYLENLEEETRLSVGMRDAVFETW